MQSAQLSDKAVKVANFTEMKNSFASSSSIKLGDYSTVQYSAAQLPFNAVKALIEQSQSVSTINQITEEVSVGEVVNVEVYVELDGSTIDEVSTAYGVKKKRDVRVYDDSSEEVLRLSVWNHHIASFSSSGSYQIKDVKVNSFKGKYLTTVAGSIIEPSVAVFKKKKIEDDSDSTVQFPAQTIDVFEASYFCKKCCRKGIPTGKFLRCESCSATSLLSACEQRYDVRITFETSTESKVTLVMPHQHFLAFVDMVKLDLEDTSTDSIQEAMLTTDKVKVTYSTRTNIMTALQ